MKLPRNRTSSRLFASALLATALLLPISTPSQAESSAVPDSVQSASTQAQQIIAELLNNMDWELLLLMQKNLLDNMDLLLPYTQEYIACLRAEGFIEPNQPLDLPLLIERASNASNSCNGIIRTLISQLDFDISQQQFEQGLSPEYQALLRKSL